MNDGGKEERGASRSEVFTRIILAENIKFDVARAYLLTLEAVYTRLL